MTIDATKALRHLDSLDYIAGLRRTGQYRKSYHYVIVRDEADAIIGHRMFTTRRAALLDGAELLRDGVKASVARGRDA